MKRKKQEPQLYDVMGYGWRGGIVSDTPAVTVPYWGPSKIIPIFHLSYVSVGTPSTMCPPDYPQNYPKRSNII